MIWNPWRYFLKSTLTNCNELGFSDIIILFSFWSTSSFALVALKKKESNLNHAFSFEVIAYLTGIAVENGFSLNLFDFVDHPLIQIL